MAHIVFNRNTDHEMKTKRHSVVVKDTTYIELLKIRDQTQLPVEEIVETLLTSALTDVEIR